MMEDDNRVYYRMRGQWKAAQPDCGLDETPPDGWPPVDHTILRWSELIVWRGRVIKDRWNTFDREEFLEAIRDL